MNNTSGWIPKPLTKEIIEEGAQRDELRLIRKITAKILKVRAAIVKNDSWAAVESVMLIGDVEFNLQQKDWTRLLLSLGVLRGSMYGTHSVTAKTIFQLDRAITYTYDLVNGASIRRWAEYADSIIAGGVKKI